MTNTYQQASHTEIRRQTTSHIHGRTVHRHPVISVPPVICSLAYQLPCLTAPCRPWHQIYIIYHQTDILAQMFHRCSTVNETTVEVWVMCTVQLNIAMTAHKKKNYKGRMSGQSCWEQYQNENNDQWKSTGNKSLSWKTEIRERGNMLETKKTELIYSIKCQDALSTVELLRHVIVVACLEGSIQLLLKKCTTAPRENTQHITQRRKPSKNAINNKVNQWQNWPCPFACMCQSLPASDDPEHLTACCRASRLCMHNNLHATISTSVISHGLLPLLLYMWKVTQPINPIWHLRAAVLRNKYKWTTTVQSKYSLRLTCEQSLWKIQI